MNYFAFLSHKKGFKFEVVCRRPFFFRRFDDIRAAADLLVRTSTPPISLGGVKQIITQTAADILSRFGISLEKQSIRNSQIIACCPLHEDRTPSFSLELEAPYRYHCFGCGASGNIWKLVSELTNLSQQEAHHAFENDTAGTLLIPRTKKPSAINQRARILSEIEIDILTHYIHDLHALLLKDSGQHHQYITKRGISEEAIRHFRLGANTVKDFSKTFIQQHDPDFRFYGKEWKKYLDDMKLINERGDYWWKPCIIIPYIHDGQAYFANARILPDYADGMKYQAMSGIQRAFFLNDDAIDEYDRLYVVEGEFNAIRMFDAGFQNVMSFGSKSQFSDDLISSLYGKDVILYFDTDANDPDFQKRSEAIKKLLGQAKSVSYFELPIGIDPNDYLTKYGRQQFEDDILANIVSIPSQDEFAPSEYRILTEAEKPDIISLEEAQRINAEALMNVAENYPAYSGKRILINMPVGTGKSTGAINLVNALEKNKTLLLTSTHYNADEYEQHLDAEIFNVHLKGRSHKDIGCPYSEEAEKLCSKGYSHLFKVDYCFGGCEKSEECPHLRLIEAAKAADVLIATHSYGLLKDFFISPYFGNKRRSLIIIDEEAELVKEVRFSKDAISHNLELLRSAGASLAGSPAVEEANDLISMLNGMEAARLQRTGYTPDIKKLDKGAIFEIEKAITKIVSRRHLHDKPLKLYDLAYVVQNGISFHYHDSDYLYYVWKPTLPQKACVIFMSATTPKAYLEQSLDIKVDITVGEQYHVKRDNTEVIQLLNVTGGRSRLLHNPHRQDHVKTFVRLALEKHREDRILIITSQGKPKGNDPDAKTQIIDMLQPVAKKARRRLVAIGTDDLESGNVPASKSDIPVIHYGIRGTNAFAEYSVVIELNAHYYDQQAIIDGVRLHFGVDLSDTKPVEKETPFRTLDKEYTVKRYVHEDAAVRLYIEANQEADIQQAEGRILRGEDTSKVIYRLHNVNVKPYPDRIYRSWNTMFEAEFGYHAMSGKLAKVWNWIVENKEVGQEFTSKEVSEALGGYVHDLNSRYMSQLEEEGYIRNVNKGGKGRGKVTSWIRLK